MWESNCYRVPKFYEELNFNFSDTPDEHASGCFFPIGKNNNLSEINVIMDSYSVEFSRFLRQRRQ